MKIPLDATARAQLTLARGTQSLRTVAEKACISHTQLARIESGERQPEEDVLRRLCKVLGLKIKREQVRLVKVKP